MNKKTGDLFEGYRMSCIDEAGEIVDGYSIGIMSQCGWVIFHPKLLTGHFFNMHCEDFFEVLGEL